jgi:polar amino acid transport system substrate-binding protein
LAAAQSDLCVAAGKPAVTLVDTENGLSPAVVDAGGADVALEDYPSSAVAASDDTLAVDLSGTPLQAAPYGFGFAKDDTALRDAVQVALQESIADGTYAEILDAYALSAGSLRTTAINGGA